MSAPSACAAGTLGLDDFTAEALGDPQTFALAHRLQVVEDDNPDPNALLPQRVGSISPRAALLPDLSTRSSAAPCDRSRPMPCAGSSRCAGARPRGGDDVMVPGGNNYECLIGYRTPEAQQTGQTILLMGTIRQARAEVRRAMREETVIQRGKANA
jgi:hypothetical protein